MISRFVKSFGFAMRGFRFSLHEQLNIKIQLVTAIAVVALGLICEITRIEWVVVLLCIALVISLEMINTAMEDLVDMVEPDYNSVAGKIKDIAAAAVLFASIIAFVIGLIIFLPYVGQAVGNFQGDL
jgi:diacylglycerol kinase (ATP)